MKNTLLTIKTIYFEYKSNAVDLQNTHFIFHSLMDYGTNTFPLPCSSYFVVTNVYYNL